MRSRGVVRALGRGLFVALVVSLCATLLAPLPSGAADRRSSSADHDPARVLSGCEAAEAYRVCFSSPPTNGGTDAAVINRFTAIFDSAGAGDTVRVAMFRWDIGPPADALIAAQARGARVEVVADADLRTKGAGRKVLQKIEDGDPARTNVVVCRGACLPWRAPGPFPPSQNVQHLKLVVADIGGRRFFTTSSANIESRQYPQYNSLIEIADPRLYGFGVRYFKRLAAQGSKGWTDRQKVYFGDSVTAAVYPRRRDLLLSTLRSVTCVPGARSVDVMISVIQRYDIRDELGRLQERGCRVRVLTTRDLVENFIEAKVELGDGTTIDLPDKRVRTIHTHDKMVALHARINGQVAHAVVTGTSNSTCGGFLYNDEVMMRIESRWLYDQYAAHFADAYHHARQATATALPVQRRCF